MHGLEEMHTRTSRSKGSNLQPPPPAAGHFPRARWSRTRHGAGGRLPKQSSRQSPLIPHQSSRQPPTPSPPPLSTPIVTSARPLTGASISRADPWPTAPLPTFPRPTASRGEPSSAPLLVPQPADTKHQRAFDPATSALSTPPQGARVGGGGGAPVVVPPALRRERHAQARAHLPPRTRQRRPAREKPAPPPSLPQPPPTSIGLQNGNDEPYALGAPRRILAAGARSRDPRPPPTGSGGACSHCCTTQQTTPRRRGASQRRNFRHAPPCGKAQNNFLDALVRTCTHRAPDRQDRGARTSETRHAGCAAGPFRRRSDGAPSSHDAAARQCIGARRPQNGAQEPRNPGAHTCEGRGGREAGT